MAAAQKDVRASLLDRLIDEEPGISREPVQMRLYSVGQIKTAVIRDLENLLNTRRNIIVPAPVYTELNQSLFVYGLRDTTSHNPRSPTAKQQLRLEVERTIARFEPRLKNVSLQVETPGPNDRTLRFRVTAMLVVEPISEPIAFDTYFDANRGEYVITG
ncbi:MAG: type VI secretion system baseplate subunit TssE [Syntrophobacteraceae bacterium]